MKKSLLLIALMLLVAVPAMAARVSSVPITHDEALVYQAYPGNSEGTDLEFLGYLGTGLDVITAVPGVLSIVPGENWENFVGAAQEDPAIAYTIKNVVLCKQTPSIIQCADVFPAKKICQQGTPNIRLWWPLMYELPGTTWTLTILYGTGAPYDDDGTGPNPAGYVHTEVWTWQVDATLESLQNLMDLFHELPFGLDEVPLISDEELFPVLQEKIDAIELALEGSVPDTVNAGLILGDFEMEVMDACIPISPMTPAPTGVGTGIANTLENPACCKLMADAEFIGFDLGILQPKK
jgi:hypothetical protein